jgi:hypothetical protein
MPTAELLGCYGRGFDIRWLQDFYLRHDVRTDWVDPSFVSNWHPSQEERSTVTLARQFCLLASLRT